MATQAHANQGEPYSTTAPISLPVGAHGPRKGLFWGHIHNGRVHGLSIMPPMLGHLVRPRSVPVSPAIWIPPPTVRLPGPISRYPRSLGRLPPQAMKHLIAGPKSANSRQHLALRLAFSGWHSSAEQLRFFGQPPSFGALGGHLYKQQQGSCVIPIRPPCACCWAVRAVVDKS